MERSRMEYRLFHQSSNAVSGPSRLSNASSRTQPSNEADLLERLSAINEDIEGISQTIQVLQGRRDNLFLGKQDLERELAALRRQTSAIPVNRKGKVKEVVVNFYNTDFTWSAGLRARMKEVLDHDSFRHCQEA